jgi:hypothetical protein
MRGLGTNQPELGMIGPIPHSISPQRLGFQDGESLLVNRGHDSLSEGVHRLCMMLCGWFSVAIRLDQIDLITPKIGQVL